MTSTRALSEQQEPPTAGMHIDEVPPILHLLDTGEELHATTRARDVLVAVTDRRLIVAESDRVALQVPLEDIRRIQFDIERSRPATMVIVPEQPEDEPQVLAIEPEEYERAARTLAIIGRRLAEGSP